MRLLDHVAQCTRPVRLALASAPLESIEVTSAVRYASLIAACPLRYVLHDDLTCAAAQLAFAEGDRLADCMDLVRIPATRLWVEWSDEVHRKVLEQTGSVDDVDEDACGRRVGVYIQARPCGCTGILRTFWIPSPLGDTQDVALSPLETHLNLRRFAAPACGGRSILNGGMVRVEDRRNPAIDALLDCARFKFDDQWAAYYRTAALTPESERTAVHGSLAAVVRDVPLLFAFFLLLQARDATHSSPIERASINEKRRRLSRAPLLDHVEVRASLDRITRDEGARLPHGERRAARLHHVRGHLVRRGSCIYWRSPHVRGRSSFGVIRTRTVCLEIARRPTPAQLSNSGFTQSSPFVGQPRN